MEAETRLARVSEEYDLLRKFSAYHFSSQTNSRATIDDIDFTYVEEYVRRTSGREIMKGMDAAGLYSTLNILDRNDPAGRHVHNFAVLMFSRTPEAFIPYSYIEIIVDWYGTKRKMETKYFKGPIWKQYESALEYLDTFLSTMVIRDEGRIENRSIDIFPKVALEELLANAIVHKNYENGKAVQIYVSRSQINIVNYNRPLPPVSLRDLNERTVFSERDTESPEIRDMFKAMHLIESFGTGIGEAKRALEKNSSPRLVYKEFDTDADITSVVIPVNEEYMAIKEGFRPADNTYVAMDEEKIKEKIMTADLSNTIKGNMLLVFHRLGDRIFGNSDVCNALGCTAATASSLLRRLRDDIGVIKPVEGQGKGRYRFVSC